jgi:arginase family enzyme
VDISKGLPAISDYGNIQITHPDGKPPSQDELLDKLSTKVNACIKRGNIPFVVGGTRDMSLGVLKNSEAEAKRLFIYMR